MNDETKLADTIEPKSDQLNADDLLTGPVTVKITNVRRGTPDQPVEIAIEGRRPFRPCKSMRRVLIAVWGDNGREWIGRSMTLFCDPSVKFGGVAVGGIRISHVSNIDRKASMMLTTTRSRRSEYVVSPLDLPAESTRATNTERDTIPDEKTAANQIAAETIAGQLQSYIKNDNKSGAMASMMMIPDAIKRDVWGNLTPEQQKVLREWKNG